MTQCDATVAQSQSSISSSAGRGAVANFVHRLLRKVLKTDASLYPASPFAIKASSANCGKNIIYKASSSQFKLPPGKRFDPCSLYCHYPKLKIQAGRMQIHQPAALPVHFVRFPSKDCSANLLSSIFTNGMISIGLGQKINP